MSATSCVGKGSHRLLANLRHTLYAPCPMQLLCQSMPFTACQSGLHAHLSLKRLSRNTLLGNVTICLHDSA